MRNLFMENLRLNRLREINLNHFETLTTKPILCRLTKNFLWYLCNYKFRIIINILQNLQIDE